MKDATEKKPQDREVKLPRPDARENPNDLDIQEGAERMQGEPVGRQDTDDRTSTLSPGILSDSPH